MNKIKFIFLYFLSVNLNAQNIIVKIEPAVICQSVCTSVYFKYNNTCKLPNQQSPAFPVQPMYVTVGDTIVTKPYSSFYTNNKYLIGIDTIYSFKICLPNFQVGTYALSAWGYCSTAYLGGSTKYNLSVVDCSIVGLVELELNENYTYYNLQGELVEPIKGELLIRKSKNTYKKVIIQ